MSLPAPGTPITVKSVQAIVEDVLQGDTSVMSLAVMASKIEAMELKIRELELLIETKCEP
jgi:hypothetical protein